MSILRTVQELFEGSSSTSTGASDRSAGAYWCHDCGERIRDVDLDADLGLEDADFDADAEGEGDKDTPAPECPSCGEEMEFERSMGASGCAC